MLMPDFTTRSALPEKMDEEGVPIEDIHQALQELEKINRLLGGYKVIFNALKKIEWPAGVVTIMDLGSGGGDMLRAIADWAVKNNKPVKLVGVDRNPSITAFASESSKNYSNIQYLTLDVFDDGLQQHQAYIIMNSLFCHHFDDDKLVALFKRMKGLSSQYIIVNDLERHWFAYYAIQFISFLFSKTYLVKYDGPLSVARSLKRKEWKSILAKAHIESYSLKWKWAWRWQLIINKKENA